MELNKTRDDSSESLPVANSNDVQTKVSPAVLTPRWLTQMGLLLELGCLLVAITLAFFGFYDHNQPLNKLFELDLVTLIGWSALGFLAVSSSAVGSLVIPWKPCREFRKFVLKELLLLFAPLSLAQIALISASAGVGEEMLFRWSLQGGLQHVWPGTGGMIAALIVASVAFGLVHAITPMYAFVATVIGILLGLVMILSGSVVPSILAHAVYDFVAILVLRRFHIKGNDLASANGLIAE